MTHTLRASFILGLTIARDCMGRSSIWILAAGGALAMLMVRWLAIQGTGEELDLFKEFGVLNLGLGGALAAVLCAVPARRVNMVLAAERAMQTRAISRAALPLGKWIAAGIVSLALFALWSLILILALVWFEASESNLFYYLRTDTSLSAEIQSLALPILLAWLQTLLLAAVALSASASGSLIAAGAAVLIALILCSIAPTYASMEDASMLMRGLAALLPDFRFYSAGETVYVERLSGVWFWGGAVQALGYAGLALSFAAWRAQPR